MSLFSLTSLFFSPWSAEWNCSKAMKLHEQMKLNNAKTYYLKALKINPDTQCAKDNLMLIKIDELSDKALKLHISEKYIEADKVYEEILKLDPKNSWAKENKRRLP
jgi:tetratricopeptide (TPR) repeat protein